MKSRGSDLPEDGTEEQREPRSLRRRWGRGKSDTPAEEPEVSGEELGWIADLRTAKQQQTELGPGGAEPGPGRAAPPGRGPAPADFGPVGPGPGDPEPGAPRPRYAAPRLCPRSVNPGPRPNHPGANRPVRSRREPNTL